MRSLRFLDWKVYRDARTFFVLVLRLVRTIPKEYRYEITNQIIRAALSVLLNIAEGSGKHSDAELNRFFDIALGSLFETVAGVDALREAGLIEEKAFKEIEERAVQISDQLGGFKKKLHRSS